MNSTATNLIPIRDTHEARVLTARVKKVTPEAAVITIDGKSRPAQKAFSCLIDPEPGDKVICSDTETEGIYILGIMERPEPAHARISLPGAATISAGQWGVNLTSDSQVTIAAPNITAMSDQALHKSREAVVAYDEITARGTGIRARFRRVSLIADIISTLAGNAIDKFKTYTRQTDTGDTVKAGQMHRDVKGVNSVNSEHTVMKSREATVIDGKKILMG